MRELPEVEDSKTFLLKQYSSWLLKPDELFSLIQKNKEQHERTLADYKKRISSFEEQNPGVNHPLFSTISVIKMGINLEEASILWCDRMLQLLR
ncbi:hypothetical protein [Virgibacillus halophilus]|uniref:hypothetical protein n=1 Tax=Tigheibacillus halophilus TaxID=361280 RepID=UPI0036F20444